jgi:hypothetical protein
VTYLTQLPTGWELQFRFSQNKKQKEGGDLSTKHMIEVFSLRVAELAVRETTAISLLPARGFGSASRAQPTRTVTNQSGQRLLVDDQ